MPMSCNLKVQVVSSCTERNPIRRRTQPDRTADAIRSDGGRNPVRRRTQSAILPSTFIYENGN